MRRSRDGQRWGVNQVEPKILTFDLPLHNLRRRVDGSKVIGFVKSGVELSQQPRYVGVAVEQKQVSFVGFLDRGGARTSPAITGRFLCLLRSWSGGSG